MALFILQCTVTCGGGVRTRNITCAKNNDEPCDISKRPNSKALCGLQQCPARKLMISPLTPERGKILIRKTAGNPRRGPPGRKTIPKPRPRVQVTTKAPETRSTLTLAPTSAIPVNSSKAMDNMEIKISQNTSTRSDDDYNPPSVFNGSSSHQNSTFCPISNSSKSENIRDAKNISNTKPSTTSEGIMVPRGVTSHSFSFTGNPEVTPGYDYLTEESDDTDWSVGGSEKPTAIPDTISNPAIKTESTRPKASSDIIKNESQTPKVSPTFIQYESSIPSSSSIVAETMAPLTTANPRNISVQIDTPVTNMAPTEGSVTIKPTVFSDILRKQNNNRMEMEHTDKITYSQSTRSPSPGGAPKNQSIISEEICPDTTELDHPTVSNGLGSGSYWIVGNWSEVSIF